MELHDSSLSNDVDGDYNVAEEDGITLERIVRIWLRQTYSTSKPYATPAGRGSAL